MVVGLPHRARGFSLVELLFVIAIFSILMGILLPSVARARAAARQAACAGTHKQLVTGLLRYAVDHDEWIPGFNTSGHPLWPVARPRAIAALSKRADAPVQVNDWISPALAGEGLPLQREDRFYTLLEQAACPEMELRAPVWIGSDAGSIAMADWIERRDKGPAHGISYLMPTNFQLYGGPRADPLVTQYASLNFQRLARICTLRPDYRPRVDSIGSVSRKIAFADGFRYLGPGVIDFDASYCHSNWGSFTERSACDVDSRSWGRRGGGGTGYNLSAVYRHTRRIVAAFWDGHAEPLGEADSRNPALWAPSRSRIQPPIASEPDALTFGYDPNDPIRSLIE